MSENVTTVGATNNKPNSTVTNISNAIQGWLGQKTTIAGLSVISGAVTAYLTQQINAQQLLAAIMVGVVAAVLKENPSVITTYASGTVNVEPPSTTNVNVSK